MTSPNNGLIGPHPAEHELADYLDGALSDTQTRDVRAHLDSCVACRSLLASAGDPLPASAPTRGPSAALPEQLRVALESHATAPPQVGQLWRLRADTELLDREVAELGVIVRVGDDILIAPATSDGPESSDLWAAQLAVDGTNLTVAVWMALQTPVGWEVLDTYLGTVDADAVNELHLAFRRGQEPPRHLSLGRPIDDELRAYRELLSARFVALSECRLLDEVDDLADDEDTAASPVEKALKDAGWGVRDLSEAIGVTARDARLIFGGQRALTTEETARLSSALGVDVRGADVRPDIRWVRGVATPLRRSRFDRLADKQERNPWQVRADVAAHAVAARGNTGADEDWDALVEQHLRRLESEAGLED